MNLVHLDPSLDEFRAAVSGPDEEIDLARASLVIAKVEYPDLDPEPILEGLLALAARIVQRAPPGSEPLAQVEALNATLFRELGLRGAQDHYYDPKNSFLNEVLERKLGIPISLSILYMSVGARAGIALGGASMPMHFLVRVLGVHPPVFVDCYGLGRILGEEECREAVRLMTRGRLAFEPEMLEVASNAAVLTRLLTNLKMIHMNELQYGKALPILDRLLILNPGESVLLRERGIVRFRLGQGELARIDLQNYLQAEVNPPDATEIRNLLKRIG